MTQLNLTRKFQLLLLVRFYWVTEESHQSYFVFLKVHIHVCLNLINFEFACRFQHLGLNARPTQNVLTTLPASRRDVKIHAQLLHAASMHNAVSITTEPHAHAEEDLLVTHSQSAENVRTICSLPLSKIISYYFSSPQLAARVIQSVTSLLHAMIENARIPACMRTVV